MHRELEYGRDIIVGVVHSGVFQWYASEKEIWVLDHAKWKASFEEAGVNTPDGFTDRFGIGVVNEHTAVKFLSCMHGDLIKTQELRAMLEASDRSDADEGCHLVPALFVDFDSKVLVSDFPEPLEFERYVPEGWTASYGRFDSRIPAEHRYWLLGE